VDASNVIAACALVGIPVSVLVSRWQMRAPLKLEHARWLAQMRGAAYDLFQTALARYRHSLLATSFVWEELNDATDDLHNAAHVIRQIGPEEVWDLAESIMRNYQNTARRAQRGLLPTPEARAEAWAAQRPLRAELDRAINQVHDSHWGK
jgi:hypothetical protein